MRQLFFNHYIQTIEQLGFEEALSYQFEKETLEEAALYYHNEKGLVIWTTSLNGKVNRSVMYGELKYSKHVRRKARESIRGLSREVVYTSEMEAAIESLEYYFCDSIDSIDRHFRFATESMNIRKLMKTIELNWTYNKRWKKAQSLFLTDGTENGDLNKSSLEKVQQSPVQLQEIVQPYIQAISSEV